MDRTCENARAGDIESAIDTYDQFLKQWPELARLDDPKIKRRTIEELNAIIDSSETSTDEKAHALSDRAWAWYETRDWHKLVSDSTMLIDLDINGDFAKLAGVQLRQRGWLPLGEFSKAVDEIAVLSSLIGERQVSRTSLLCFLAGLTNLDSASWDVPVGLLLERVVKLGVESELGAALVELLGCEMLQKWADMIKTWNAVWQRLGANIPGLVVPLRLLDTASNYLVTERCECLLKLPLEERKLLMEVLRVPNDSF